LYPQLLPHTSKKNYASICGTNHENSSKKHLGKKFHIVKIQCQYNKEELSASLALKSCIHHDLQMMNWKWQRHVLGGATMSFVKALFPSIL